MSYSRWISSDFYTYWLASRGTTRDEQVLMVHDNIVSQHEITYREAKNFVVDQEALKVSLDLNDREAEELTLYIKRFIEDVDEKFKD
jgi:hypothetical protein